jgi:hypothetical protein
VEFAIRHFLRVDKNHVAVTSRNVAVSFQLYFQVAEKFVLSAPFSDSKFVSRSRIERNETKGVNTCRPVLSDAVSIRVRAANAMIFGRPKEQPISAAKTGRITGVITGLITGLVTGLFTGAGRIKPLMRLED